MEPSAIKRILIVDDEEVVRSLCARILTPAGYVVEVSADGPKALERLAKQSFDLVLTDYRMPGGMDGLELGQLIKQQHPRTQIVLMTAFPAMDTAVEMLRMGATDYMIKPFEPAELLQCIDSSFLKSRAE